MLPKPLKDQLARDLYEGRLRKVQIDSREVRDKDIFIALPGNSVHGNTFAEGVLKKADTWVIADRKAPHPQHDRCIPVSDPEKALTELAKSVRALSSAHFTAITGSNGKTTTKELTATILGAPRRVLKTQGNYNNHLGVPLTLCMLKHHHRYAVVEVGTSNPGEIHPLTNLVRPHFSVLTSVHHAHLSGFRSLSAIADEKSDIFRAAPDALCFVRQKEFDHPTVRKALKGRDVIVFDAEGSCHDPDFRRGHLEWSYGEQLFKLSSPAPHNALNAQASIRIGQSLGMTLGDLANRLQTWMPADHRMCLLNWKKRRIIDDCYNANPASVLSALDSALKLRHRENQRVFVVMGDMKEMGRQSRSLHRHIGEEMAQRGVDVLLTLGDHSQETLKSFAMNGGENFKHCEHQEEMAQLLQMWTRPHDILLVKGSRTMRLEKVIEALEGSPAKRSAS